MLLFPLVSSVSHVHVDLFFFAEMISTPQKSALYEKKQKYDRQLRLWGVHGQAILEDAFICLVNATVLGTEIMKCLVMPGVGGFTIVDDKFTTEEDIGCNFFLDWRSIGESRAKCCTQLLQELNTDVQGDFAHQNIDTLIDTQPEFFRNFDVVVATAINEQTSIKLSNLLWEQDTPLIVCRSIGFYGVVRLQIREHCIVESHPDSRIPDLRLQYPFEGLKKYMEEATLSSNAPWLVILYKCLQEWIEAHEGKYPTDHHDQNELRDLIRSKMVHGDNFEEAIRAVNSSLNGGKPNSLLNEILMDDCCVNVNTDSKPFWVVVRALRDFIENEGNGYLPLPGVIPDMTSASESYIELQQVYRTQAVIDSGIVFSRARQLLEELNKPSHLISENLLKLFCREAASIAIVRGSKIADEYSEGYEASRIFAGLETPDSLMGHYVTLRAIDKFQEEQGYLPGENRIEKDTLEMKSILDKMISNWGINTSISDSLVQEFCRFGGAEVPTISALLGGCVAQELIKLITKQYKPVDNVFVYDGVTLRSQILKL